MYQLELVYNQGPYSREDWLSHDMHVPDLNAQNMHTIYMYHDCVW